MATVVQSNLVPITLSTDSGTTYRAIVCKKGWTFNHETATTEEQTDCGTLIGLGSNSWSFDVDGIFSTDPGGSEIGAEELIDIAGAQTLVLVKAQYPTSGTPGANVYLQGSVYITNVQLVNSVGSLMNYTLTLKGSGTLDTTE